MSIRFLFDAYDEPMETTELARRLGLANVRECVIESNNGGRGFARNVTDKLKASGNRRCTVTWFHQSKNKRTRILVNAASILDRVVMPEGWEKRWPSFYLTLTSWRSRSRGTGIPWRICSQSPNTRGTQYNGVDVYNIGFIFLLRSRRLRHKRRTGEHYYYPRLRGGKENEMELTYSRVGDYLVPDVTLSDPPDAPPLGLYGLMHKAFLKEHRLITYNCLLLTERLYPLC